MNFHYLCVILIADPTNQIGKSDIIWHCDPNVFTEHKKVWQKYINNDKDILCLFYNSDKDLEVDYKLDMENNTITVKGIHSYEGIDVPIKSLKVANDLFSYDYILHTTSSSFWVLSRLKDELIYNTPKTQVYKGRCGGYNSPLLFVSGSGIIMTKDVISMLVESHKYLLLNTNTPNDVLISLFLNSNNIHPIDIKWWYDFDHNTTDDIYDNIKRTDSDNICHYRIRNNSNRLYYDTIIMNILYNYYYK